MSNTWSQSKTYGTILLKKKEFYKSWYKIDYSTEEN